jgi:hypothetical protein
VAVSSVQKPQNNRGSQASTTTKAQTPALAVISKDTPEVDTAAACPRSMVAEGLIDWSTVLVR